MHQTTWPTRGEVDALLPDSDEARRASDQRTYDWATDVLFEVRKHRSEARQPLKVPITLATVTATADRVSLMPEVEADLRAALRVQRFECSVGEQTSVAVAGYDASPSA